MKKGFFKGFASIGVFLSILPIIQVFATSSVMDTSFNTGLPIGFGGGEPYPRAIATQSDGKMILGGGFSTWKGTPVNKVIRLNTDGSLDTSFTLPYTLDNKVFAVAIQNDGKILIGGRFQLYSGSSYEFRKILRLNTDGSIDTGFNTGSGYNVGFDNDVYTIKIADDGKILVGGTFRSYRGITQEQVARLNTDGSLDTGFTTSWMGSDWGTAYIYGIDIQNDNKVVIAGDFITIGGVSSRRIARLHTNGSLDTGFVVGNGLGWNSYAQAVKVQNDGKILVGGHFTSYSDISKKNIVRINTDGSIDTGFNISGGTIYDDVYSINIDTNNKILIGSAFKNNSGDVIQGGIARLHTDGTIDTGFNIGGTGGSASIYTVNIQTNGNIVIGGYMSSYNNLRTNGLVILKSDGTISTDVNTNGGFGGYSIDKSIVQSDGKILIAGNIKSYKGTPIPGYLARLNTDGTLDNTFTLPNWPISASSLIQQKNGKIIAGIIGSRTVRLNIDGTLDTDFVLPQYSGFSGSPVLEQEDGKILLKGVFTANPADYYGTSVSRIIRLNADLSTDTGFNTGSGFKNSINGNIQTIGPIAVQTDGKMIVGGTFDTYNRSTTNYGIIRLNTDGSKDTGFIAGFNSSSDISDIKIQADGKILIVGGFSTYNGTAVKGIIRINTNGSLDTGFSVGTLLFQNGAKKIELSTGTIFVLGNTNLNGDATVPRIFALNTDGSTKSEFTIATGFNGTVSNIALGQSGNLFVGGASTAYNGIPAGYFVSLYGDKEVVALPASNDTGTVNDAFTDEGYILDPGGDLIGSDPISLSATDGSIPINLSLRNTDVTMKLDANTQIQKSDTTNYNGLLSVAETRIIPSVNDEVVIKAFNVGSISESIILSGNSATLSTPVDKEIGDLVNINYSNDNGVSWYLEQTGTVIDNNGVPSVQFTTDRLTNFAITQAPDKTAPIGTISYSTTTTTANDIVATLSINEDATITNNDGNTTYTFTGNGSFTFEFTDTAGNTGSATATVSWIDKARYNGGGASRYSPITKIINKVVETIKGPEERIGSIKDSRYPIESNNAYLWAYKIGITKFPTIQQANLDGKLYRSHLAKMISEYAVKQLKKTANTGAKCEFTDMANQPTEMKVYAQAACQLGLMGLKSDGTPDTKFNPTAEVTRAQFGTTLSRLLYGASNNEKVGGERYTSHLNALKKAGIMTKIDKPTMDELRGNVFLMLMRTVK